ncbi:hypothetical protein ACFLYX_01310 [Chloroflexota bacterium]
MTTRFQVGDRVIITPVQGQTLSVRDSEIDTYAGQAGEVTNYHSISPTRFETFYIYTVRIGTGPKEIVLYEDEIAPLTS